ncbi:MAG: 50S ribosomal protein L9 [Candidatus Pacebacteria bacterium]|nr:50S ribosomal protein L9 [Candidatus Paceibacterota bacterium]
MKVILLKNVAGIGKANELKDVPNGYARNFLFPKKLAILATKDSVNTIEQKMKSDSLKNEKDLAHNKDLAERLKGYELNIRVKVGSEGQLFESVTKQKIADKLNEQGFGVDKNHIELEDHIKQKGTFPITIRLDHGFASEIRVVISEE